MMSFAGIDLPVVTPPLAAWVEQSIPPGEVYEFEPSYDSNATAGIPAPPPYQPPPVRTGVLYWPTGATRWAVFHAVVSGDKLAELRVALADGMGTGGYKAADLVLDDGKTTLTTEMLMIPPRPLSGWFPEAADGKLPGTDVDYRELNDLWLLTLVDARFFWWFRQGVPSTAGGFKTMVEGMLTFLGETATVPSDFGDGYPSPKDRWVAHARPVPVSLEAACSAVGRKLVRKLDGTLEFQTWEDALAAAKDFLVRQYARNDLGDVESPPALTADDFARVAGGVLDYEDLARNVPAAVRVYYANTTSTDVALAALAITEYGSFTGRADEKAVLRIDDLSAGETGSAATFAQNAAEDYYGWQLANVDLVLGGLAAWDACGWQEAVRYNMNGPPTTRIVRPPFGLGAALGVAVVASDPGPAPDDEDWELGIITGVNNSVSPPLYGFVKGTIDPSNGNFAPFDANVLTGYRAYTQSPGVQYSPLRVGDVVLYRKNPANEAVHDLTPWQSSVRFVEYEYVESDAFDVSTCQMVQNRRRVKLWVPGGHADFLVPTGGPASVTP